MTEKNTKFKLINYAENLGYTPINLGTRGSELFEKGGKRFRVGAVGFADGTPDFIRINHKPEEEIIST